MLSNLFFVSGSVHPRGHASDIDILRKSDEDNKALELTGCLLRGYDWFAHSLEGDDRALAELFAKIRKDPRHRNVAYWWRDDAEARNFKVWQMLFITDSAQINETKFRSNESSPEAKHAVTQSLIAMHKHASAAH